MNENDEMASRCRVHIAAGIGKMLDLKIDECQLESKKYSIFIGISVGIKPMSIEIARKLLEWGDKHSCDTMQILIADEIAKYNYLAFSHYTKKGYLSRALRDGDKYCDFFEKAIATFPLKASVTILI
jgi:hypothetical protein